jgi:bifunctional N-acetylglucosamine-1-phosphate-uridyltransferase/glucosamine-1-phosphate-acetyltransferase GlmU-like protein
MTWHNASNFFAPPEDTRLREFFSRFEYVWDILDHINAFIIANIEPNVGPIRKLHKGFVPVPVAIHKGKVISDSISYEYQDIKGQFQVFHKNRVLENAALVMPGAFLADDYIQIGCGVLVESGAMLCGPTILGPDTTVRQAAYVRGNVFTTSNSLIGHSTEAKNVIMMDHAKAGHFAYLGDSVIGNWVNLGAGTKLANLKMSSLPYHFNVDGKNIEVKRRKFGAILGDGVESGCNSVTNPGTLLGQNSRVMPNTTVKSGYHEPLSVLGVKF